MRFSIIELFCIVWLFLPQSCFADIVIADTSGFDNFSDEDFYGVTYESGTVGIHSISWDLSAFEGAVFDFDGSGSYLNMQNAVLHFPSLSGLQESDIEFTWDQMNDPNNPVDQPTTLTALFTDGSFEAGDSFRFAADTDFLGDNPETNGSVFGELAIRFSVQFADQSIATSTFEVGVQENTAVAVAATAIPEPSLPVLAIAFALTISSRRRRSIAGR